MLTRGAVRWIKKLIKNLVDKTFADVHTHVLVQIESYNNLTNMASVVPCIKRIRSEDPNTSTTIKYGVIEDVPVVQEGSGKLLLACPPAAGSYGVLHICERAHDEWLTMGGIVDPTSVRKFNINDGFLQVGAYPLMVDGDNGLLVVPVATDRIELRTRLGTSYVGVLDDGSIEIGAMSLGTFTIGTDGTITGSTTLGDFSLDGTTGQFDANGNFTVDK